MAFDINSFLSKAQEEQTSQSSGDTRTYPYKVVYVHSDQQVLNCRLLPNSKTNSVVHKYWLHDIGNKRHSCGYNHAQFNYNSCPICEAITEVKSIRGKVPYKYTIGRALCLAQYISSQGFDWNEKRPEPQKGEIIIVMGPSGLYDKVQGILLKGGAAGVTSLLTNVVGQSVMITRNKENRIEVNVGFESIQSSNTQDEYNMLIDSLPGLNTLGVDENLSQEDLNEMNEVARVLRAEIQVNTNVQTPTANVPTTSAADQFGVQSSQVQTPQQVPPVQPSISNPVPPVLQTTAQHAVPQQSSPAVAQPVTPQVPSPAQPQNVQVPNVQHQQPTQVPEPVAPTPAPVPQQATNGVNTYSDNGTPSNCPQSFDQMSTACMLCLNAINCPFQGK